MQAKFFAYMLHIIGDPRAGDVAKFIHKVVNPPWTTTLSDIDSGISVMHFMEGFYGELYVEREIHLKEVNKAVHMIQKLNNFRNLNHVPNHLM